MQYFLEKKAARHLGRHAPLHVAAQRLGVGGDVQQRLQDGQPLARIQRLVALPLQRYPETNLVSLPLRPTQEARPIDQWPGWKIGAGLPS